MLTSNYNIYLPRDIEAYNLYAQKMKTFRWTIEKVMRRFDVRKIYMTQKEKKGEAEVVYLKLPFIVAWIQSRYKME